MLGVEAPAAVTDRLHIALADPHNLAGWTQPGPISTGPSSWHEQATTMTWSPTAATAEAASTCTTDTLTHLGNSTTDLARSDPATAPTWAAFFDITEISAISGISGIIHTELAHTVDPAYTRSRPDHRSRPVPPRHDRQPITRPRALATSHLLQHDLDHAVTVGAEAIRLATTVRSTRVQDRLRPLKHLADHHPNDDHARELSERIHAFTTMQPGCHWATHRPEHPCTPDCATPCTTVWRPPPATQPTH